MSFKIVREPQVWTDLEWFWPDEAGVMHKVKLALKLKLLAADSAIAFADIDSIDQLRSKLGELVTDWQDVVDVDNRPLPFSLEALHSVIDTFGEAFLLALIAAYAPLRRGQGRAKN